MGRDKCKQNCNICIYAPNTCKDSFECALSYGVCGSDCKLCSQSELACDKIFKPIKKNKYNLNFSYFKPYFDVTLGHVVESKKEINEYCKRNDMVYAGDKELTQQCAQNKKENEVKFDKKFNEGLLKELGKVI